MKKFIFVFLLILVFLPLHSLADLEVHFLDVGHGDCSIIICDGEAMIIDGGDSQNSDKVFSVIQELGITELKYAVATHPQDDHVGGLASVFYAANVGTLYTPVTEYDNDRFEILMDKATANNVPIIVPTPGDTFQLGGATITVLAPIKQYKDINDMSIVLRLDYGETSFLFSGDAGASVEKELINAGVDLDVDVLKVAHHGSNSASTLGFISAVSPQYAIISCSSRYDNPDEEVLSNLYGQRYIRILRTDVNGDICAHSDGEQLTFSVDTFYVANINTEVYHRSTCASVTKMKESNKAIYYTTGQADHEGYRPCKNCSP